MTKKINLFIFISLILLINMKYANPHFIKNNSQKTLTVYTERKVFYAIEDKLVEKIEKDNFLLRPLEMNKIFVGPSPREIPFKELIDLFIIIDVFDENGKLILKKEDFTEDDYSLETISRLFIFIPNKHGVLSINLK